MSIEEADEQKANPNFVPIFIPDPNGTFRDNAVIDIVEIPNITKKFTSDLVLTAKRAPLHIY